MAHHTRDIVHAYYEAWAGRKRDEVRKRLNNDFKFTAPNYKFNEADAFLECCWQYSKGLAGVEFHTELYDNDRAFVILIWKTEDGKMFAGAEYVRVKSDRLAEILVVNNDPELTGIVK